MSNIKSPSDKCLSAMKLIHKYYVSLLFLGFISLLLYPPQSKSATPDLPSWGYIYHASALSESYLAEVIPRYNVICLSGYKLTDKGTIRIEPSRTMDAVNKISAGNRVTIYPMISFESAARGHRLLNAGRLRDAAARSIAALASDCGYSGVHIDFEYLPPRRRTAASRISHGPQKQI
jgi:spore germination protein YaaH